METRANIKFVSQLKINTAKKVVSFETFLTEQSFKLAKILKSRNIIQSIELLKPDQGKGAFCRVYPNHSLLINTNNRLKLYSRNTPHLTLSFHGLKLLSYGCGDSTIVLETTRGLITHQEALTYKIGGELFAFIYV